MIDINLQTQQNASHSVIHCGKGAFDSYAPQLKERQLFIVTDTNVYGYYGGLMRQTLGENVPVRILPAGEKSKTQRCLTEILQAMVDCDMKRGCTVIAFGGGVVGDIAGLAASLYMRGVHVVQIPTTLLSQVDSSVGGKTAVDFNRVKNLIGTFYQPEEVIVDPRFLATLPPREIRCGLGEIIKYGALDSGIYKKLLANADNLTDLNFLEEITADCIRHKAEVVTKDEHDLNGARKTLNLGHTTGHAFELYYKRKSHGEFVLIGTYYELHIAKKLGLCNREYGDSLIRLIKKVINIPAYDDIEKAALMAKFDKKNAAGGQISLIVPKCEGESREIFLGAEEYANLLTECRDELRRHTVKTLNLAVIGKDVSKSTSPQIHKFIAKRMGNKINYKSISIPEPQFESKIESLFTQLDGFNVTIPYKLSIMPYLKKIGGDAEVFGAVNTVRTRDRAGDNTDGMGFSLMLKNNGVDVRGKEVLLLGGGGAGRSVAKKLADAGAKVSVYDTRIQNCLKIAEEFGGITPLEKIIIKPYFAVINATGIGMHKTEGISPVGEELLSLCEVAVDLIYTPKKSRFLQLAESAGKKIINGEAMLFYQAYYSECIYFGVQADEAQAKKLFEQYTEENL